MTSNWPALSYGRWAATCDTLHACTQILGKLAVQLAPAEPELLHAGLQLTPRGWETAPLPAPDGSGSLVVMLDLHAHEAVVQHSNGAAERIPLTPDRPVAEVTSAVLQAVARLGGEVEISMKPQEVPWSVPLDQDYEHASYDAGQVSDYLAAATQASLALAAFRAPYRGRSTQVNAWWGSFDLSVTLFSGAPSEPPGSGFITRNSSDAEQFAVGWWPGDPRHQDAAFYAFAYPGPADAARAPLSPSAAHWDKGMGEFILNWDDVRAADDPRAEVVEFARSALRYATAAGRWEDAPVGSTEGMPPPIR
jgi:Family of unknown function (DUF5996)